MKIYRLLFYLLILLLPTQLGKHFWPNWSFVQGIRIDYLSPTIYFTDLLIFAILATWLIDNFKTKKIPFEIKNENTKSLIFLAFILLFLLINVFFAQNREVAFYKLIKIFEFGLLGFYIAKDKISLSAVGTLLSIGIIYSSIIAILQFIKQGSLGGLFWFMGERTFNAGTLGIAQAILDGRLTLRSYATFSHPNVLGGFLAIILPFLIWVRPRFRLLPFFLGIIALLFTFSRLSWLAFGITLVFYGVWFLKSNQKKIQKHRFLLAVLLISFTVILSFNTRTIQILTKIEPESIIIRQDLNDVAIEMIRKFPIFGVGLGNFLVMLPEFYPGRGQTHFFQPAHNIYLLITAETGLIGLGVVFLLIYATLFRLIGNFKTFFVNFPLLIAFFAILFLSLFDHYFYTLQQGQLLLTLVFGLAWNNRKS